MVLTILTECKTEKRNSQCEHGQPLVQAKGLYCTCDSGVACCQSQHHCHFWRMIRSSLYGQVSLAAVNQICVIYVTMNGCKNLKNHLRLASKV